MSLLTLAIADKSVSCEDKKQLASYADDHAGNVYRFINIQTKKILLSRDIQWLNSFWKEYKKRKDDSRKLVDVFYSQEEDEQTQEESEVDEPNEVTSWDGRD